MFQKKHFQSSQKIIQVIYEHVPLTNIIGW